MNNNNSNTNSKPEPSAAMVELAAERGITVEQAMARFEAAVALVPTVGEHSEQYLAALAPNTRRSYGTHIGRLVTGIGPICDQTCDACMDRADGFVCKCACAKCRISRITVEPQGPRLVGLDSYSAAHVTALSRIALRVAKKSGTLDNRARAARGLSRKPADGFNASETSVHALRGLFGTAKAHLGGVNPGLEVVRPKRGSASRRPLQPFELVELRHLTANGGDDPALDELLFDFSVATAARRDGACALIVGRIYRTKQMIGMIEKYGHEVEMPVSVKMIERLLAHAIARGGPQCDPTSDIYRPDAPVFWRREGRLGFKPVTGRRFDTLHHRWQTSSLPFANEDRATYHIIRHTMGAIIGSTYGESYKARYLRHTVTNVTGGYGKCTDEELAAAMAHLLRFEHPLVQGRDERRAAAMKRFGLEG